MEKIYTSVLNKRDLIADSDYLCWQLAAESGHAHILEAIYGWTSDPAKEKMVYGAGKEYSCFIQLP